MLHWIFFKPLSLLGLLYGMRMLCNENNQDYQDCLFIWIRLVKLKFDLDLYFIWRVLDLVVVVVLLILLSVLFYFKTCIFGFGLWAWQSLTFYFLLDANKPPALPQRRRGRAQREVALQQFIQRHSAGGWGGLWRQWWCCWP